MLKLHDLNSKHKDRNCYTDGSLAISLNNMKVFESHSHALYRSCIPLTCRRNIWWASQGFYPTYWIIVDDDQLLIWSMSPQKNEQVTSFCLLRLRLTKSMTDWWRWPIGAQSSEVKGYSSRQQSHLRHHHHHHYRLQTPCWLTVRLSPSPLMTSHRLWELASLLSAESRQECKSL